MRASRGRISEAGFNRKEEEELKRLEHLACVIEHMPVWPFDAATLRRFLTAYLVPILTVVLSPLLKRLAALVEVWAS